MKLTINKKNLDLTGRGGGDELNARSITVRLGENVGAADYPDSLRASAGMEWELQWQRERKSRCGGLYVPYP